MSNSDHDRIAANRRFLESCRKHLHRGTVLSDFDIASLFNIVRYSSKITTEALLIAAAEHELDQQVTDLVKKRITE